MTHTTWILNWVILSPRAPIPVLSPDSLSFSLVLKSSSACCARYKFGESQAARRQPEDTAAGSGCAHRTLGILDSLCFSLHACPSQHKVRRLYKEVQLLSVEAALDNMLTMHNCRHVRRLLSTCPPLYWFAAELCRGKHARWVWTYFLAYGALGYILFAQFYPWT